MYLLTMSQNRSSSDHPTPTQVTVEQVINRVITTGKITLADKDWFLRAALSDDFLTSQELRQVRNILDRLQMGLIKVVE
jgi:hypothetical protein